MGERIQKLTPTRDLQCYFLRPSAIAAISSASETSFQVSGCWRQQFDWAVIEWNRDNVFEHPALRYLPDGDLSGLKLSYVETRENCIPLDSTEYATVDWPYLRIWLQDSGAEEPRRIRLRDYATPLDVEAIPASAMFELTGAVTPGDYVELSWLDEHYTYRFQPDDLLANATLAICDAVNTFSETMTAAVDGPRIILTWIASQGANGNRIGAYGNVSRAATEAWTPTWQKLAGGVSPSRWKIELDFAQLKDVAGEHVPTTAVRKMRWTYSAAIQDGAFARSEFAVLITDWTVEGERRVYCVAGPGSRRIEDDNIDLAFSGTWSTERGNFSGGSIRYTSDSGAEVMGHYMAARQHELYLGTRRLSNGGTVRVRVDGVEQTVELQINSEDTLVRVPLGLYGIGEHELLVSYLGGTDQVFYFDFLELAVPVEELPEFQKQMSVTLATDWDTDHSIAIAPERTAWLMHKLGYLGRANHYAGALWFYELECNGQRPASATIEFGGTPEFGKENVLSLGPTMLKHVSLIADTPVSIAKAFELIINAGSSGVWARAAGNVLTITARQFGSGGDGLSINVVTNSESFVAVCSGPELSGGLDRAWHADVTSSPRVNRAARDWTKSFCAALHGYGIDAAVAFSTELQHGDDSVQAGIAQRFHDGTPKWVDTPALQTNFSDKSLEFWREVYSDMAAVMQDAGILPYLQFGEIQWWYFPMAGKGMPFYDAYSMELFQRLHGRSMKPIAGNDEDTAQYADECQCLADQIGDFTAAVMAHVKTTYPDCKFEVLYPPDVNKYKINQAVNLPRTHWTPAVLDCFKTENFTFTFERNLDDARVSINLPMELGFQRESASHLVGIGDYTSPWRREADLAMGRGVESVVLFALDQFCLIGYDLRLRRGRRGVYLA